MRQQSNKANNYKQNKTKVSLELENKCRLSFEPVTFYSHTFLIRIFNFILFLIQGWSAGTESEKTKLRGWDDTNTDSIY